jgi:hypothetical protein
MLSEWPAMVNVHDVFKADRLIAYDHNLIEGQVSTG